MVGGMTFPFTAVALLVGAMFCCSVSYRAGVRRGGSPRALRWHATFWGMTFFVTVAYMADRFAQSTSADFGPTMWALCFIAEAIVLGVFALPAWAIGRLQRKPPQSVAPPLPLSPVWRPPLPTGTSAPASRSCAPPLPLN
jgi:hypothetical protein